MIKYISTSDELRKIKNIKNEQISEIILSAEKLIKLGILNYAIKYSLWKIKDGGKITVLLPTEDNQSFSKACPSTWQVFNLLSQEGYENCLKYEQIENEIIISDLNLQKYQYNGLSIGILFSGNINEESLLIESLSELDIPLEHNCEIIICGPENYDFNRITLIYPHLNIKYLVYELESFNDRIFIAEKKNFLYQYLQFDIKVIAHSRIKYKNDFIQSVLKTKFDIVTPKIFDSEKNRYLDLVLIGTYDTSKLNTKIPLLGEIYNDHYLDYLKYRVAYIDGGIIIFNSKIVGNKPFNNKIAWCEGEDIDVAKNCYNRGILIDILDYVHCTSLTRKFHHYKGFIYQLKRKFKLFLLKLNLL